jgi:cyclopropane-fatty-acyl-phospholipid synthase
MQKDRIKTFLEAALAQADIVIDGGRPWDPQVKNGQVYKRIFREGELGIGESYMDGWWECEQLDVLIFRILQTSLRDRLNRHLKTILSALALKIFNWGARQGSKVIAERHYDIGNDLFRKMLDQGMNYSCGYWKTAGTLDEAQEAKLDLVCRKLGVEAGMTVLDIGCGWGGFLKYAAEKYGIRGVGVTLSSQQASWGRQVCAGLPVEIHVQDYRDVRGKFDRIVSIGMFEHVCGPYHRKFMEIANDALNDEGLFLLHTIGADRPGQGPWSRKYIFPVGELPSLRQVTAASQGLFVMEDLHNFGADYDRTLMAWFQNFDGNWESLKLNYGERFYRMWKFYLLSAAASFRVRKHQLWQIVLSKKGVPGGYVSLR